ncbi:MAG: aminotransferase class I/II-fold pyridoxal phosphate-dependent enzyme [Actinomycetota bacterium]|jgi:histidinol-phosphate aminotransferase|nr:aminotransferase class I/II-fold pyridoxal phosphate-dependent enzyme [Actinomycetota bacterium]
MKPRVELDDIRPYEPPRMAWEIEVDRGSKEYAKLTMNELSFGPLPEARAAAMEAISRANRYPARDADPLRKAISAANPGITAANVVVGNGSSEVLVDLLQILDRPGEVVFPWPSFPFYSSATRVVGLTECQVALDERHAVDLDALHAAVGPETRAVILCNPNNPTGTYLPLDRVRSFAGALPERVLLILDEAYYEFVEDPAYAGSHELVLQSTNVVSSRTFSKVHGLAGFRIGFGIAPLGISDYAWRAHVPFSVSIVAQAAAEASMGQTRSITERARFMTQERERLQTAFDETGLEYVPSHTNFILVRTGPAVFERTGVLVREGEALGYPGWSRISIGSAQENDRIMAALT